MTAMARRTALQVNAALALAATAASAAIISLVLTQPAAVGAAMAQHEYGAIAVAVGREMAGWLSALLHFV